ISTKTKYVAPVDASMPGLAVEVTQLVDSCMIWIGVAESPETVGRASVQGKLCRDWAVAMAPRRGGETGPGTWLFRSEGSDGALSMAQRLARRLGQQIFVSVDVDSVGERMLLVAERAVVETV
ncbi:hypothetical protein P691DRAFT_618052, partial [Macrolepiota fuliginosa MF-IS2]